MDLLLRQVLWPKEFLQHRGVAGILELSIRVVADKVKEGNFETFGELAMEEITKTDERIAP